jgi:hypothetical protein
MTERYLPTQAQVDELRKVFGPEKLEAFLLVSNALGKAFNLHELQSYRELSKYLTDNNGEHTRGR